MTSAGVLLFVPDHRAGGVGGVLVGYCSLLAEVCHPHPLPNATRQVVGQVGHSHGQCVCLCLSLGLCRPIITDRRENISARLRDSGVWAANILGFRSERLSRTCVDTHDVLGPRRPHEGPAALDLAHHLIHSLLCQRFMHH